MDITHNLGLKIWENCARTGARQQKRTYPRSLRTITSHNRTPTTMPLSTRGEADPPEEPAAPPAAAAAAGDVAAEEDVTAKPLMEAEEVNEEWLVKLYPTRGLQAAAFVTWLTVTGTRPEHGTTPEQLAR